MRSAPVLTSLDTAKLASFIGFMTELRTRGNVVLAGLEAERLKPYLEAFSAQVREDARGLPQARRRRLELLSAPEALATLFSGMARKTGTAILSEFAILSHEAVTHAQGLDYKRPIPALPSCWK